MLWRRRYYHRFTLAELEIRREKRALIVQRALRLFAIVLALCLTMLLSLVCFKPWKDLRSLEHERSFLQARLEKAQYPWRNAPFPNETGNRSRLAAEKGPAEKGN